MVLGTGDVMEYTEQEKLQLLSQQPNVVESIRNNPMDCDVWISRDHNYPFQAEYELDPKILNNPTCLEPIDLVELMKQIKSLNEEAI